jgi:hypothetical protein
MNTPDPITSLEPNQIFVFGSNLEGRHGKGAAKDAMKWGAKYRKGEGPSGQTYALPTKGYDMEILALEDIGIYVKQFLIYAAQHPDLQFLVTRIGCGLANYKDSDIAPFFKDHSSNVVLPKQFSDLL